MDVETLFIEDRRETYSLVLVPEGAQVRWFFVQHCCQDVLCREFRQQVRDLIADAGVGSCATSLLEAERDAWRSVANGGQVFGLGPFFMRKQREQDPEVSALGDVAVYLGHLAAATSLDHNAQIGAWGALHLLAQISLLRSKGEPVQSSWQYLAQTMTALAVFVPRCRVDFANIARVLQDLMVKDTRPRRNDLH